MTLSMSGATPSDTGLASGLVNTSAQVGGALGLAVLATLAAQTTTDAEASGDSFAEALNAGFHVAYLVAAALVGIAVLVAVFVLRPAPMPMHGGAEDPAGGAPAGDSPHGSGEVATEAA